MLLHDIIQAQFFEARASKRDETDGAREPPPSAIDVTWLDHVVALIIAHHYLSGYFCMWITH